MDKFTLHQQYLSWWYESSKFPNLSFSKFFLFFVVFLFVCFFLLVDNLDHIFWYLVLWCQLVFSKWYAVLCHLSFNPLGYVQVGWNIFSWDYLMSNLTIVENRNIRIRDETKQQFANCYIKNTKLVVDFLYKTWRLSLSES